MALSKRGLFRLGVVQVVFVSIGIACIVAGVPAVFRFGGWGLLAACFAAPIFTHLALWCAQSGGSVLSFLFFAVWPVGLFGIATWLVSRGELVAGVGAAFISILLPPIVFVRQSGKRSAEEKRRRKFVERGPIGRWEALAADPSTCRVVFEGDGDGFFRTRGKQDELGTETRRFKWWVGVESQISVEVEKDTNGRLVLVCGYRFLEKGLAEPIVADKEIILSLQRPEDDIRSLGDERSDAENSAYVDQLTRRFWPGGTLLYYCGEASVADSDAD